MRQFKIMVCMVALGLGAAVVGLIGCTTEAAPLDVTYYYLPG